MSLNITTNTSSWITSTPTSIINTTDLIDNSTYSNVSIYGPSGFNPWIPVPAGPPVIITTGYTYSSASYWDWFYAYLIIMLVLVLALGLAKVATNRGSQVQRQAALQRRARRRAQGANANATNNVSEQQEQTKSSDLPPAYDEAVTAYINAKQDYHAAEEGSIVTNGMSQGVSTITILTEVDANPTSSDLNVTTNRTATTEATCQTPPPTYDHSFMNDVNK